MCHDDLKMNDTSVTDQTSSLMPNSPESRRHRHNDICTANERAEALGEGLVVRKLCVAQLNTGLVALREALASRTFAQGRVWWWAHHAKLQGQALFRATRFLTMGW